MDTGEYKGEQFLMFLDPNGNWHIHNRFGCRGTTNHPIAALQQMQALNWQILASYHWGPSLALPTGLFEITPAAIEFALSVGEKAWLN